MPASTAVAGTGWNWLAHLSSKKAQGVGRYFLHAIFAAIPEMSFLSANVKRRAEKLGSSEGLKWVPVPSLRCSNDTLTVSRNRGGGERQGRRGLRRRRGPRV